MALTRGKDSGFPCPVCLVPKNQTCTGAMGDLRTTESMERIYKSAKAMDSADERENLLKSYSLRDVEVCKVCIMKYYICVG